MSPTSSMYKAYLHQKPSLHIVQSEMVETQSIHSYRSELKVGAMTCDFPKYSEYIQWLYVQFAIGSATKFVKLFN